MKRTGRLLVLAMVMGVSAPASADGFGEFLGRLNPARFFNRGSAEERRPESPGMTQLREQLERRGLSEEEIDQRIEKIEAARANGIQMRQAALDGGVPDLDALRTLLEERGLDETEIEQRIARIEAIRARRMNGGDDITDGQLPDLDRLRARLEERGIDPTLIDERIARIQGALDRRGQPRGRQGNAEDAFGVDGDQVRMRMPPVEVDVTLDVDGPELPVAVPMVVEPSAAAAAGDVVTVSGVQPSRQPVLPAVGVSESPAAVTQADARAGDTPPARPTLDRTTLRERMQERGLTQELIEQRLERLSRRSGGRR